MHLLVRHDYTKTTELGERGEIMRQKVRDAVEPRTLDISVSVGSPQFHHDQVRSASVLPPDYHPFHVGALIFETTARPLDLVC